MPYLFRSLLVPFFIFASSIAALAGPITGRVLDPDGRAVGGADVLLVRGGAIASTTRTDSTGAFRMDGPDDGRVEIRVALEGFHARPVTIEGGAGHAIWNDRAVVSATQNRGRVRAKTCSVALRRDVA